MDSALSTFLLLGDWSKREIHKLLDTLMLVYKSRETAMKLTIPHNPRSRRPWIILFDCVYGILRLNFYQFDGNTEDAGCLRQLGIVLIPRRLKFSILLRTREALFDFNEKGALRIW